jgi:hypothetical protein
MATTTIYNRALLKRITVAKRDKDLAARVILDGLRPTDVAKIYGVTVSRVCAACFTVRCRLDRLIERDAVMGVK